MATRSCAPGRTSAVKVWYINNTMVLELADVTDDLTGQLVTTASVHATLYDPSGAPVPGATNLDLLPVELEPGTYRTNVPNSVSLTEGMVYLAVFTADPPNVGEWVLQVMAQRRYA